MYLKPTFQLLMVIGPNGPSSLAAPCPAVEVSGSNPGFATALDLPWVENSALVNQKLSKAATLSHVRFFPAVA